MSARLARHTLSENQFDRIRQLLYGMCRIDLKTGKENLVEARLSKRLRQLGLEDFDAYIRYVEADGTGGERALMMDALTTNKTSFFRESQHFDFLRRQVLPRLAEKGGKIRFWCAGCSSGEEPFTLSMVLCEEWPDLHRMDVRILASDISSTALDKARRALYAPQQVEEVPPPFRNKYFSSVDAQKSALQVDARVRELVHFAALNLVEPWPMQGPFDAIFCRNVMIYFDQQTREELVRRFFGLLRPGGLFFISHSESLNGLSHEFRYVQPAVYAKSARPASQ